MQLAKKTMMSFFCCALVSGLMGKTEPNMVLIGFADQTVSLTSSNVGAPEELDGALLHSDLTGIGVSIYSLPENTTATEFCADLMDDGFDTRPDTPAVLFCEPDAMVSLDDSAHHQRTRRLRQTSNPSLTFTDDPLLPKQYYLSSIAVDQVWNQGLTGNGSVRVCILDSGIDVGHPDLQDNVWVNPGEIDGNNIDDDNNGVVDDIHGASFLSGKSSGNVTDQNGHGTLVSGVIGATVNNNLGVAGITPNVSLIMCKFMGSSGNGQLSDAVSCYNYCLQQKAHIIQNSWGSSQFSQALNSAFQALSQRAVLIVASAGNDGVDTDSRSQYPSGFSGQYGTVLSVAALDTSLALASYSNRGAKSVQLGAPGTSIQGLWLNGGYMVDSGTSFAAPQVSATAALLYGYLANNRSINIDTQNVATLVANAILNGTKPYPNAATRSQTSNGYLYVPTALQSLIDGLTAQNNTTTAISGAASIVIGIVIGLVVMFFIMTGAFFLYLRYKRARDDQS